MDASEKLLRSFESLDNDGDGRIWTWQLLSRVGQVGIDPLEPRVRSALEGARDADGRPLRLGPDQQPVQIDYAEFVRIAEHGDGVIGRALNDELAMSRADFAELSQGIKQIHADVLPNRDGEVADYIPTLRDADPEPFAITMMTADGQVFEIGDTHVNTSIQSTVKPFIHLLALKEHGRDGVGQWVGTEQSGGPFNDPVLSLGPDGRPQNAMINAGAIGSLALVGAGRPRSERIRIVSDAWTAMTGKDAAEFDAETYHAEDETGDNNRRLAFGMASMGKLKGGGGLANTAEATQFYFEMCSLKATPADLAAYGATLANGGVAPYTGQQVFSPEHVNHTLMVMHHSGMYDKSLTFNLETDGMGDTKSGVSGYVVYVVPSRGLAIVSHSPRLDEAGNSVRGVEVCKRVVPYLQQIPSVAERGAGRGREELAVRSARPNLADQKAEMANLVRRALEGPARAGSGAPAALGGAPDAAAAVKAKGTQQTGQQL